MTLSRDSLAAQVERRAISIAGEEVLAFLISADADSIGKTQLLPHLHGSDITVGLDVMLTVLRGVKEAVLLLLRDHNRAGAGYISQFWAFRDVRERVRTAARSTAIVNIKLSEGLHGTGVGRSPDRLETLISLAGATA